MAYYNEAWHSHTAGEIFETDGILKRKADRNCYEAINSKGKKACAYSIIPFYDFVIRLLILQSFCQVRSREFTLLSNF